MKIPILTEDDYGYFGKGIEGYIHYKQTFDECFNKGKKPSNNSGCLTAIISVIAVVVLILITILI